MSAEEIADGVYRLGTEWLNWYLVVEDGRITVVDTGLPGYWGQLDPALDAIGRSVTDVEAVLITHHHSDHTGCAEPLRSAAEATVFVPAGEAPIFTGEKKPGQPEGVIGNLWRPVMIRFMHHALTNGAAKPPRIREFETFSDGETLDAPGSPRAIATPGHSPDHQAFHFADHGVLFTGDAMATVGWVSGSTDPQLHPFGEDRSVMPATLDTIEPLTASVVAFGHGEPFAGSPADAVASAREHAG